MPSKVERLLGVPRRYGFGLYVAWLFLVYYQGPLHSSTIAASQLHIFWIIFTLVMGSTHLSFVWIPTRFLPISVSRPMLVAAGSVAGLGSLLSALPSTAGPWMFIGAALAGFGAGLLVVMWGEFHSTCRPKGLAVCVTGSFLLGMAVYYATLAMPHGLGVVLTAVYPAISLYMLARNENEILGHKRSTAAAHASRWPASIRWRIALGSCSVGISYGLFRVPTASGGLVRLVMDSDYLLLAHAIVSAILLAVALLMRRRKRRFDLSLTYGLAILGMAVGYLVSPMLPTGYQAIATGLIIGGAWTFFYLLSWLMYSDIAARADLPAARVYGLGKGMDIIGALLSTVTIVLVSGTTPAERVAASTVSLIAVFMLLVVVVAVSGGLRVYVRAGREDDSAAGRIADQSAEAGRQRGLTVREREVLALLVQGRSLPYIERELHISHGTANAHVQSIYRKFGVHTRQGLLDNFHPRRDADR